MATAQKPLIIAIKGYPCTGKSTLAHSLTKALKCPLVDHESVFNCMANVQEPPRTSSMIAAEAEHLNDVSYDAVCEMALTQLSLKFSVIIDASLTQRSHMDRLLQLSRLGSARLIIIDCKARNKYVWRDRVESRQGKAEQLDGILSWYKPSTWEGLESLMERYDWCAGYDVGEGVSELVVNSTGCTRDGEFVIVNEQADSETEHTHLVDIVRWIRKESLGPLHRVKREEELRHIVKRIGHPSGHVHQLKFSHKGENDGEIACRKCLELITGPVYRCNGCNLSLHISCAELPHRREVMPHHLSSFVDQTSGKFNFPENHSCPFHTDNNMGFLDECEDCLFHTSLRCGLFPMVLYHRLHKGPLSFLIYPIAADTEFMCTACGETSKYMALYECNPCNISWHVGCALLPFHFKHEIHRCPLHLGFWHADDDSDSDQYFCNVCEQKRNPKHMVYICREHEVACHLSCMNFVE